MEPVIATGTEAGHVAGRIGLDLGDILARWEDHLRARHCSEHSIAAMLGDVRRGVKMQGWKTPADFTYQNIMGHLESFEWAASTYNRNLSVFRSLTRWLLACEMIDKDPLKAAQRAEGAGGPGSRAATTDDARAIVRAAWLREQQDGRARRTARSLYWACLFLTGARMGEPGRWRWGDLILDEAIPSIVWTPETQKSKRREEIVICDQLAELLRRWRDQADDTGRDAPVFPSKPNKRSFADDRNRAGVKREDSRGRPLTAHSARKWFRTSLIRAGVAVPMVNKLMRHSEGTPGRYYDPTRQEMADAANLLDFLWPEVLDRTRFMMDCGSSAPKSARKGVVPGPEMPYVGVAEPMNTTPTTSRPRPRTLAGVHGSATPKVSGVRGFGCDGNGDADGAHESDGRHYRTPQSEQAGPAHGGGVGGVRGRAGGVGNPQGMAGREGASAGSHRQAASDDRAGHGCGSPELNEQTPPAFANGVRSGDFVPHNAGSNSAVSDLLRAVARLLEERN